MWWQYLDGEGRQRKQVTRKALHLYIPNFFGQYPAKKARNGSFGDKLCPNRGSPSRLKLCSWWNLPPLASANYVSPELVNDGSGLQSSELSLHDLIHCSLIGRVLELWILQEWRLLSWCVAEVVADPDWIPGSSLAWHGMKKSEDIE